MPIGGARRSGASRCVADRAGASRRPRRGAFPTAKGRAKSPYLFHHIGRGCVKKKLDRETGRVTHHSSASLFRVGALLYMCSTRSMTATS